MTKFNFLCVQKKKKFNTMLIKLFENFNVIRSLDDLKSLLDKYQIDVTGWGKVGGTKSINSLFNEIKNKECIIDIIDGRPIRKVEVATLIVTYKGQKLKEDYQKFTDGRVRRRNNPSSCSEKMHLGENPMAAAVRCAKEELGLYSFKASQLRNSTKEESGIRESMSYPGLDSMTVAYKFECELTDEQYNPDGYIEKQKDKSTFFVWE